MSFAVNTYLGLWLYLLSSALYCTMNQTCALKVVLPLAFGLYLCLKDAIPSLP